jgi:hypothetical protein
MNVNLFGKTRAVLGQFTLAVLAGALLMVGSAHALNTDTVPTDLTSSLDWQFVITTIVSVAGFLATIYGVRKGIRMALSMISR